MSSVKEALDIANPNNVADNLRAVTLGTLIEGLIPRTEARTGLASSATQVESEAGPIHAVESPAGTNLVIVGSGVTPAAGQVAIAYNAQGIATLTFNAAVTAYTVVKQVLPANLQTVLDADSGAPF